jgi:amino acid transporter
MKQFLKAKVFVFGVLLFINLVLLGFSFVFAQEQNQQGGLEDITIFGHQIPAIRPVGDFATVFNTVINIAFGIAGVIAFLYLLYAGFQYLTAGSGDAAENAKKTIVNAILGILIIFLSLAIVTFVINALNRGGVGENENTGQQQNPPRNQQQGGATRQQRTLPR